MSQPKSQPKPESSPDYQSFVASVTGSDSAFREAVDEEALLRLEKDERRSAEELLIRRLDLDDRRAPPALARSECRGAVGPMKRRLPKAEGRMRIAIALALADLGADAHADETVAEVLRSGDHDAGIAALSAAESMRTEPVRQALIWAAQNHPSPDVRGNAGAVLLYAAGVAEDPLAWDYRPMWLPLGDDDPAVRQAAFDQIRKVTDLTDAG
jgi:hypothetical protein